VTPGREHDVSGLTKAELERARRDLQVSLSLAWPGSLARVPILAHLDAVDAELAERGGAVMIRLCSCGFATDDDDWFTGHLSEHPGHSESVYHWRIVLRLRLPLPGTTGKRSGTRLGNPGREDPQPSGQRLQRRRRSSTSRAAVRRVFLLDQTAGKITPPITRTMTRMRITSTAWFLSRSGISRLAWAIAESR
jgi:hypothetical protein